MGDHRLPKRVMSGELENAGKRGSGGKKRERTDCVEDDRRVLASGDWKTPLDPLEPGVRYITPCEGGRRFMAAWVREKDEKVFETRQRKRETDTVEVAPGVTVASLRHFGPTQGASKPLRR